MGKIDDYSNKNASPSSKNSQKDYNVYNQSLQVSPQYKSKLPPKSPARG